MMDCKGMHKPQIKAFKIQKDYIELFEDESGTDLCMALPKWMFNQIVEKAFKDVKVKP